MSTFAVIGDIHGCLDEFKELVAVLRSDFPGVRILCLGDFLDKGPFGPECVAFARAEGLESVLGNHEEWGLRWLKHERLKSQKPGYVNPMITKIPQDLLHLQRLTEEDVAWLQSLPAYITVGDYVIVHGGLQPGLRLEDQEVSKMIRLRWVDGNGKHVPVDYSKPREYTPEGALYWMDLWDGPHHVIYGHEAHSMENVRVDVSKGGYMCYGVDTAVVHGGVLSAIVVHEGEVSFRSVRAKKLYLDAAAHRAHMLRTPTTT